jgi:hypothetical protein
MLLGLGVRFSPCEAEFSKTALQNSVFEFHEEEEITSFQQHQAD